PTTLAPQLEKLRKRFALSRIVMVGDRGMLTQARIREELRGEDGLDWITCLRAPAIAKLRDQGVLQLSLFDERDMAEVVAEQFPGERLVVCRNPFLAEERARKREALLQATERELERVRDAVRRAIRPLRGQAQIGLRVGRSVNRFKVRKHFKLTITDMELSWERDEPSIAAEAAMDGIYVVRTTVPSEKMPTPDVVRSYKRLANVERAFRSIKTAELHIRPIHHRTAGRVRAHVLLCMLAYYVEWHMRRALAPILFDDDDPDGALTRRDSVVAPARRSMQAEAKARTKHTASGHPVHSFRSLLRDLSTIAKNRVQPRPAGAPAFDLITRPTPLQQHAIRLLGLQLLP
ncbi:transposase, partial [Myxococcota bacterium]